MSVSIGNELKDGFKSTNNWISNNIQFLSDIEQFYRQRAIIEAQYATSLQKLTSEFLKKKANKSTNISVGDKPIITPGSLESASLSMWTEILSNTEVISTNHLNYSKELNIKISDQLLGLQKNCESIQSKIETFHNSQFQKQKDDLFDQVKQSKKQYDDSCQNLETARSKLERNQGSSRYQSKYNEKEVDMNVCKNNYLLRINVANRIKDKFYYQDLPEILDLYQDLNEFKTKQLNTILLLQSNHEISLNNKNIKNLNSSIEIINQNLSNLDIQMFIKHNIKNDWADPQDFYYIPSSIWHDDDTFITKPNELNELKKTLLRSKKTLASVNDQIESEKETLNQIRSSKQTLKDLPNDQFEFKKSLDLVNSYFQTLTRFISDENKKVEAQVEIETISNNVDKDISLEGLTLETKKTGFLSKFRPGHHHAKEALVSTNDTFDDANSIQSSDVQSIQSSQHHSSSSHFKISSLLRSKSTASKTSVTTVSQLQGTANYDYQATGDDEISISANETFTVVDPDDGSGWTNISLNGREGLVPTSYITVSTVQVPAQKKKGPEVKPRKSGKKVQYCTAKFDYEAEDEGELSISEGERLQVVVGDDEGWTTGVNSSGAKGTFPTSYVEFDV